MFIITKSKRRAKDYYEEIRGTVSRRERKYLRQLISNNKLRDKGSVLGVAIEANLPHHTQARVKQAVSRLL